MTRRTTTASAPPSRPSPRTSLVSPRSFFLARPHPPNYSLTHRSCFNNCPDDSRAGDARGQVQIHCENASLFGSSATTPTKSGSASTDSSAEPTSTSDSDSDSDSDSQSAEDEDSEDDDGAAAGLALNMGGLVLGVAGVMAALV